MTGSSGFLMSVVSSRSSATLLIEDAEIVIIAKTIESIMRLVRICMA